MASLVQKECREEAEAEETERRRLEEAAAEEKNGPMTTAQKVRQKNSWEENREAMKRRGGRGEWRFEGAH